MLKTAGYAFAVCAIGTLAVAWSHTHRPQQNIPVDGVWLLKVLDLRRAA